MESRGRRGRGRRGLGRRRGARVRRQTGGQNRRKLVELLQLVQGRERASEQASRLTLEGPGSRGSGGPRDEVYEDEADEASEGEGETEARIYHTRWHPSVYKRQAATQRSEATLSRP